MPEIVVDDKRRYVLTQHQTRVGRAAEMPAEPDARVGAFMGDGVEVRECTVVIPNEAVVVVMVKEILSAKVAWASTARRTARLTQTPTSISPTAH
jgi:hypothetical protein